MLARRRKEGARKGNGVAMGDGDALADSIPLVAAGSRFGDWGLRAFIA